MTIRESRNGQDAMPRTFEYLLNAMEAAAQAHNPHREGYFEKRRAVFQHVEDLWSDYIRLLREKQDRLNADALAVSEKLLAPIGYAVQMQDGPFVGIWQDRADAEHICSKQPASHNDRVVPVYAALPDDSRQGISAQVNVDHERAVAKGAVHK